VGTESTKGDCVRAYDQTTSAGRRAIRRSHLLLSRNISSPEVFFPHQKHPTEISNVTHSYLRFDIQRYYAPRHRATRNPPTRVLRGCERDGPEGCAHPQDERVGVLGWALNPEGPPGTARREGARDTPANVRDFALPSTRPLFFLYLVGHRPPTLCVPPSLAIEEHPSPACPFTRGEGAWGTKPTGCRPHGRRTPRRRRRPRGPLPAPAAVGRRRRRRRQTERPLTAVFFGHPPLASPFPPAECFALAVIFFKLVDRAPGECAFIANCGFRYLMVTPNRDFAKEPPLILL